MCELPAVLFAHGRGSFEKMVAEETTEERSKAENLKKNIALYKCRNCDNCKLKLFFNRTPKICRMCNRASDCKVKTVYKSDRDVCKRSQ